jgi:hypothetical protein
VRHLVHRPPAGNRAARQLRRTLQALVPGRPADHPGQVEDAVKPKTASQFKAVKRLLGEAANW